VLRAAAPRAGSTATLHRDIEAILPQLYADALELADISLHKFGENDAAARLPAMCPYTLDQICECGWYPTRPK
jgi:hypothetical protein